MLITSSLQKVSTWHDDLPTLVCDICMHTVSFSSNPKPMPEYIIFFMAAKLRTQQGFGSNCPVIGTSNIRIRHSHDLYNANCYINPIYDMILSF